ncbi:hypothetical protein SARC_15825, partial [Sphaeroforma arctica JP610]
ITVSLTVTDLVLKVLNPHNGRESLSMHVQDLMLQTNCEYVLANTRHLGIKPESKGPKQRANRGSYQRPEPQMEANAPKLVNLEPPGQDNNNTREHEHAQVNTDNAQAQTHTHTDMHDNANVGGDQEERLRSDDQGTHHTHKTFKMDLNDIMGKRKGRHANEGTADNRSLGNPVRVRGFIWW